jgi:hypothetical protein
MGHGLHGNEATGAGAAMAEAYHLLAARNDPDVDLVFRESLVLIDPNENPDGRARFIFQNTAARARGRIPTPGRRSTTSRGPEGGETITSST